MKRKRSAVHWDYTKRTGQEQARTGQVERDMRVEKLRSDLTALETLQTNRPTKPPQAKQSHSDLHELDK